MCAVARPALSVHDENIEPAIAVRIEESAARPERLRQPLLTFTAGVVLKVDVRFRSDVSEPYRLCRRQFFCPRRRCRPAAR
jgi:hypothetical protein